MTSPQRAPGVCFAKAMRALLLALAPAIGLCAAAEAPADSDPPPAETEVIVEATLAPDRGPAMVIGPFDLIEIKVFQFDKLNQTVRVSDDGTISLPLIGRVQVSGLTREQVERRISELLERGFINDPQVSVFVREYESRKLAVTGAVQKPGLYEMLGQRTVLEMLAAAGGVTKEAGKQAVIIRRSSGEARRIPLALGSLADPSPAGSLAPLQPGDILFVPAEETVKVYVHGSVREPGAIEMKSSEPFTILQAVAAAAGLTDRAAERRVQVIRTREDGVREIIAVDLRKVRQGRAPDIPLVRDDVIYVPESYF